MQDKKIIIIGSGPAGFTAAIYAARAALTPILFEGFDSGVAGGQLMTTTDVENYPGFPDGIMGPDLMEAFRKQAIRFGTIVHTEDVLEVDLRKRPFHVKGKKHEYLAHVVIVATGATAKRLDIPGTKDGEFWQKGVTSCAVCDGAMPIFRDKDLYVIGGGDTAMEEALFLIKYGKKVIIVHRRDTFRASKAMSQQVLKHPKIEVIWNHVVTKVEGNDVVQSITLQHVETKQEENREAAGLFFAIGHTPNTAFLNGQLVLEKGYIQVRAPSTHTNIEGVFAVGDVQDPHYRQAVSAAGSGCMGALDAERWLSAQGLNL